MRKISPENPQNLQKIKRESVLNMKHSEKQGYLDIITLKSDYVFILLGQTLEESEISASGSRVEGLMAGAGIRSLSLSPLSLQAPTSGKTELGGRGSLNFIAWNFDYYLQVKI